MKTCFKKCAQQLLLLLTLNCSILYATSPSGFYLPEPIEEVTMRYISTNNLIILPVVINGNLTVNLVLDTGTRNIVLFGKRFQNLFQFVSNKSIRFSGMGSGKPVLGKLSINNTVELTSLIGEQIPLIVVPNKNIFIVNPKIDGIIGYDIFQKFEVEINPYKKLITFRSPLEGFVPPGFIRIPMHIENTKPIIDSKIMLEGGTHLSTNLMIDTGSQLSILLKTTDDALLATHTRELLGRGMSGDIEGIKTMAHTIDLVGVNFRNQPTEIILSTWHNYGSIGMGILKEYAMIINYTGAYTCLRKL